MQKLNGNSHDTHDTTHLPAGEWSPRGNAPATTPGANAGVHVRDILGYKWSLIGLAVLFAVPALAVTWFMNKPTYEARATVEVSPMIPRIVYETEQSGIIPLYEQFLNDQVSVLRSPTVLERALDEPDVQATKWYAREPQTLLSAPISRLERLRNEVSASVRPRTSFIDVTMSGDNPEEAALIVNAIVEEYLGFVNEKAQRIDDDVYEVLVEEHSALRATIDGLKSVVSELRTKLLTADPNELQVQQRRRLDQRVADLEQTDRRLALVQAQRKDLAEAVRAAQPGDGAEGGGRPPYARDPDWRRYFMEYKAAQHDVETQSARLGSKNDEVEALRDRAAYAKQRLEIRETQLDELLAADPDALNYSGAGGNTAQAQLDQLARDERALQFERELLADAVNAERARLEETAAAARMLRRELDELRHAQQRFDDVRERKVAMEIERRAPASIRIQDRAYAPSEASNAKRRWMLALLALAGSLGFAGLLTLVRIKSNHSVQTAEDLGRYRAPFLGQVLWIKPGSGGAAEEAEQSESIRIVRTALLHRVKGEAATIQITSASAETGKTTAALLLARSLARCGNRVLVIDADLRRPAISDRTDVHEEPGLTDVLRDRVSPREAIQSWSAEPRVDVLPAGRPPEDDWELLSSEQTTAQLAAWKQEYDLILIDGPPLLPIADGRILASLVDGNILVVRESHSQRGEVVDALGSLQRAGGTLFGMLFFSNRRTSGYYGYGYEERRAATVTVGAAGDHDED